MLDNDISTAHALAHLSAPEDPAYALDRRRFLQLVGMGVGAGLVAGSGGTLLDHVLGHDPSAWAAGPVGPTDGILVVIGMYGGNDGLNTVVPFDDGHYYDMHGSLAIPGSQTLSITSNRGFNAELTEFKRFWDAGELAIVEGIGYPDPDLSHFNSMGYWMAGRPHAIPSTGWLGRWLDGHLAGSKDLYAATEIGSSVPLHLIGAQQRGTVVPPNRPGYGADRSARSIRQYDAIRAMGAGAASSGWARPVGQAFVDQLELAKNLAPIIPDEASLPEDRIVAQLEIAARLINANLGFRVLTAGFGDFDSHAGQPAMHQARMAELNAAIRRFFELLDSTWERRVAVMTFSEFGRTPWDNDGLGSDHGTSAPHFVIGKNVKGGLYGRPASLRGLGRWDRMAHHVDFRSYYASIIDGWLGGGSSDVLGSNFENLGLFARGPGRQPGGGVAPGPAPTSAPSTMTPIAPVRIVDTRFGTGAPQSPLGPGARIRVKVAGVGGVPKSGVTAVVANVTAVLPTSAMYFTVYPGGSARPETANLNAAPGRPVPNLVVMGVSSDGYIEVFNSHGATHCVVDVFGYAQATGGARLNPVTPARLFDSRRGRGVRRGRFLPGEPVEVQVAGRAGVPASGASAVVMNLTAVAPDGPGHLRVTPAGQRPATTANVNFGLGDTVPNLVICKLGANGKLAIDAGVSSAHVVGDVFGYLGTTGDRLVTMSPRRFLDSRFGIGAPQRRIGPDHTVSLGVAGVGSVPDDATAVVLNVAATNVAATSHVSVWPGGGSMPGTANLNLQPGQTIANLVVCRLGDGGAVSLGNPIAECDLIGDVLGYFVA